MSLGDKVVLLNLVLRSNPILFKSFMKMPVSIQKKLVGLQRHFL